MSEKTQSNYSSGGDNVELQLRDLKQQLVITENQYSSKNPESEFALAKESSTNSDYYCDQQQFRKPQTASSSTAQAAANARKIYGSQNGDLRKTSNLNRKFISQTQLAMA